MVREDAINPRDQLMVTGQVSQGIHPEVHSMEDMGSPYFSGDMGRGCIFCLLP